MLARAHPPDAPAADRICGGTFHAIAHRIIRAHAESFALPPEFSGHRPGRRDRRAGHAARRPRPGRHPAPRAAGGDLRRHLHPLREHQHAGGRRWSRPAIPWCADFTAQLGGLFRAYGAHKRAHGLVDFDDLLLLWRAALADPAAGPALRGLFDAVLVDEYQDVNAVQADIVRLLRPDGAGLTCVGDDAQAIYAFRGADPAHLRALAGSFPDLTVVRLVRNYRSRRAHPPAGQRGPAAVRRAGAGADRGP